MNKCALLFLQCELILQKKTDVKKLNHLPRSQSQEVVGLIHEHMSISYYDTDHRKLLRALDVSRQSKRERPASGTLQGGCTIKDLFFGVAWGEL